MSDSQEGAAGLAESAEAANRLNQSVEIRDVGPCRKHIVVTVDRADIDKRFDTKYTEILRDQGAPIAGFRPGKAPRKIIEKRFAKDVSTQVKAEVLMASLGQLATEQSLTPLAPPDLNPSKIDFPKEGPLVYEFEIEVAPEFELPEYKGLKLRKPVKDFTDADIDAEERKLLENIGQIVPKDGPVVEGDVVTVDFVIRDGDTLLQELKEARLRVNPRLVFNDGVIDNFSTALDGAEPGDIRKADLKLSTSVLSEALRGKVVQAEFTVRDVKTVRAPELTPELLEEQFGVKTRDQLRELIRGVLERRLEYTQRQSARAQVLSLIAEASSWDLPRDLLLRQSQKALARKVMEMQSAGMSEAEIRGQARVLSQDVLQSTAAALKEHFVLQKVAEVEKLEIGEDDIDDEIERIADRSGESPRRVRARLEKEDMLETLATELLERKALDLILSSAEYDEVPLEASLQDQAVESVEAQVAPDAEEPPSAS